MTANIAYCDLEKIRRNSPWLVSGFGAAAPGIFRRNNDEA